MKLNTAPKHEAIMGNISDTGEFRIRNSSKAFEILSSGLYANKIRAIIRELSCNAWDSHVAAGNTDQTFDLHLPTQLAPYFSIRDYGTGLTHDQVVNIYTTYFESTKTDSNEFIGALGLGSKSPFSYTDNFTVTAIRDGVKCVYTAFINENGVPSVARMADMETDEPNGVEVKFSVENSYDFAKFAEEAKDVLMYFQVIPRFTGRQITVNKMEYDEINIVEGINVIKNDRYYSCSFAVMGNIAYPISIPNAETNLGVVANLLSKNLEIHFNIGEIEFQASREGLSYTKFTIQAIRKKLELLQEKLDGILFEEADKISNLWERAFFLQSKANVAIWHGSVYNYRVKRNLPTLNNTSSYSMMKTYAIDPTELEKKYNLAINGLSFSRYSDISSTISLSNNYDNPKREYKKVMEIRVDDDVRFVKYPKFRGGIAQTKYHFKHHSSELFGDSSDSNRYVYILSPVNSENEAKYDEFFAEISNPPESYIFHKDDLSVKPKEYNKSREKNVSILYLSHDPYSSKNNWVWQNGTSLDRYDDNKTYYYMPLSGYSPISKDGYYESDAKTLAEELRKTGFDNMFGIGVIYGVRKADMPVVEEKKNWVNIQDKLIEEFSNMSSDVLLPLVISKTKSEFKNILSNVLKRVESTKFAKFFETIDINLCKNSFSSSDFYRIFDRYNKTTNSKNLYNDADKKFNDFIDQYPLVTLLSYDYSTHSKAIDQFVKIINMVEQK